MQQLLEVKEMVGEKPEVKEIGGGGSERDLGDRKWKKWGGGGSERDGKKLEVEEMEKILEVTRNQIQARNQEINL